MSPTAHRARAILVTCLDAACVVSASAALVIALGGRTRLPLSDTVTVSLRGAWNLWIAAAVFAVLRLAIGRGLRPLPAVPIPDNTGLEAERQRFVSRPAATRDVRLCAAAALLGSIVWIVPHLIDIRQVPDPGDPLFSAWRIARLAHQLAADPRHLFDGNQFYPRPLTLTYSDSTFLEGLLGAPFILMGADALIVANALTLVAFPLCGLAVFYAAWRLVGDPRAALVAALVGAWYPFHAEHYPHLELQWVMFVPLAIVAALDVLAAPSARRGLLFGLTIAVQWLASMYLGVMLLSFLAPFLLVMALAWRVRPSRELVAAAVAAAVVLLPAIAGLGAPYLRSREARGERSLGEVQAGSAIPADYGATHFRLTSYSWHSRRGNHGERELFPGTSTLALGALGIAPPLTGASIAMIVAGSATFDWSLGLNGLTYGQLYAHSLVYRGMRAPARFTAVLGCALALLGAVGARRLIQWGRSPRAQAVICASLAIAVLFDLRVDARLQPYFPTIPPIYAQVTPQMVLAELPRGGHEFDYLYFSTTHWANLLGGYSGFMPWDQDLESGFEYFPAPAALDRLRAHGATHVTYTCAFESSEARCGRVMKMLEETPALELVATGRWQREPVVLYRFK